MPENLAYAFNESKRIALQHLKNPRIVPLAFYTAHSDEETDLLGPDPWQYGLNDINGNNVETALRYTYEQGLVAKKPEINELVHPIDTFAWSGREGV